MRGGNISMFTNNVNQLILVLVKEKIIFTRIIRPNIFNTLKYFFIILNILKILDHFHRCPGTNGVVYQLIF